jgi:hypothetical protein
LPRTVLKFNELKWDKAGDILEDTHKIYWITDKSPLLRYVIEVNDARQNGMHTAELQAAESTASDAEMVVKNLKIYNSQDVNQIPAQLTKARCRTLIYETYKCVNPVWIKTTLSQL